MSSDHHDEHVDWFEELIDLNYERLEVADGEQVVTLLTPRAPVDHSPEAHESWLEKHYDLLVCLAEKGHVSASRQLLEMSAEHVSAGMEMPVALRKWLSGFLHSASFRTAKAVSSLISRRPRGGAPTKFTNDLATTFIYERVKHLAVAKSVELIRAGRLKTNPGWGEGRNVFDEVAIWLNSSATLKHWFPPPSKPFTGRQVKTWYFDRSIRAVVDRFYSQFESAHQP
jgi:hypothetical protein